MSPNALRSWQAMARQLSDNCLHALLRGLRSGDERVAPSPLYYSLICGEALSPLDALTQAARIEHQVALAMTTPGLPTDFEPILNWQCWWHRPDEADGRYGALAEEVVLELERRERCGPTKVRV